MGGVRGRVYAIGDGILHVVRRRVKQSEEIDIEFKIVDEYTGKVNNIESYGGDGVGDVEMTWGGSGAWRGDVGGVVMMMAAGVMMVTIAVAWWLGAGFGDDVNGCGGGARCW
nr:hypothetical protein [Tanacetum cinerariifolium]